MLHFDAIIMGVSSQMKIEPKNWKCLKCRCTWVNKQYADPRHCPRCGSQIIYVPKTLKKPERPKLRITTAFEPNSGGTAKTYTYPSIMPKEKQAKKREAHAD